MKSSQNHRRRSSSFGHAAKALAASWIALLLLLSMSLATSYLHLGIGNVVAGIGIACVKTAIVAWWFMHLRTTLPISRAAGGVAVFLLAVLLLLSSVDYLTRLDEPARVQAPRQIRPVGSAHVVSPSE